MDTNSTRHKHYLIIKIKAYFKVKFKTRNKATITKSTAARAIRKLQVCKYMLGINID